MTLELQTVLKEALRAASWKQCRQLLYHESLRYVSTAATHGKRAEANIEASPVALVSSPALHPRESGRVVSGAGIDKLMRSTSQIQAVRGLSSKTLPATPDGGGGRGGGGGEGGGGGGGEGGGRSAPCSPT